MDLMDLVNGLKGLGGGKSIPAPSGGVANQAIAYLIEKHNYSPSGAAAIVANLHHESGLRPGAVGDGGTSFGIAQWHNERATNAAKFIGKPLPKASLFEQLDFLNHELQGYKGLSKALRQQGDPGQLAAMFTRQFERPADPNGQSAIRAKTAYKFAGQPIPKSFSDVQPSPQSAYSPSSYGANSFKPVNVPLQVFPDFRKPVPIPGTPAIQQLPVMADIQRNMANTPQPIPATPLQSNNFFQSPEYLNAAAPKAPSFPVTPYVPPATTMDSVVGGLRGLVPGLTANTVRWNNIPVQQQGAYNVGQFAGAAAANVLPHLLGPEVGIPANAAYAGIQETNRQLQNKGQIYNPGAVLGQGLLGGAMGAVPAAFGSNALARVGSGAAMGAATGVATPAIEQITDGKLNLNELTGPALTGAAIGGLIGGFTRGSVKLPETPTITEASSLYRANQEALARMRQNTIEQGGIGPAVQLGANGSPVLPPQIELSGVGQSLQRLKNQASREGLLTPPATSPAPEFAPALSASDAMAAKMRQGAEVPALPDEVRYQNALQRNDMFNAPHEQTLAVAAELEKRKAAELAGPKLLYDNNGFARPETVKSPDGQQYVTRAAANRVITAEKLPKTEYTAVQTGKNQWMIHKSYTADIAPVTGQAVKGKRRSSGFQKITPEEEKAVNLTVLMNEMYVPGSNLGSQRALDWFRERGFETSRYRDKRTGTIVDGVQVPGRGVVRMKDGESVGLVMRREKGLDKQVARVLVKTDNLESLAGDVKAHLKEKASSGEHEADLSVYETIPIKAPDYAGEEQFYKQKADDLLARVDNATNQADLQKAISEAYDDAHFAGLSATDDFYGQLSAKLKQAEARVSQQPQGLDVSPEQTKQTPAGVDTQAPKAEPGSIADEILKAEESGRMVDTPEGGKAFESAVKPEATQEALAANWGKDLIPLDEAHQLIKANYPDKLGTFKKWMNGGIEGKQTLFDYSERVRFGSTERWKTEDGARIGIREFLQRNPDATVSEPYIETYKGKPYYVADARGTRQVDAFGVKAVGTDPQGKPNVYLMSYNHQSAKPGDVRSYRIDRLHEVTEGFEGSKITESSPYGNTIKKAFDTVDTTAKRYLPEKLYNRFMNGEDSAKLRREMAMHLDSMPPAEAQRLVEELKVVCRLRR